MYWTFNFKVKQVIYFEIVEILNIGYVSIDTEIKFIACKQPELSKIT